MKGLRTVLKLLRDKAQPTPRPLRHGNVGSNLSMQGSASVAYINRGSHPAVDSDLLHPGVPPAPHRESSTHRPSCRHAPSPPALALERIPKTPSTAGTWSLSPGPGPQLASRDPRESKARRPTHPIHKTGAGAASGPNRGSTSLAQPANDVSLHDQKNQRTRNYTFFCSPSFSLVSHHCLSDDPNPNNSTGRPGGIAIRETCHNGTLSHTEAFCCVGRPSNRLPSSAWH